MNSIEKLIEELCPDGVATATLGEVVNYEQPTPYLVNSTQYSDEYQTPVLTAGQTFILGFTNEKDGIYKASSTAPAVIFDDFTTASKWVDFNFKAKSSAMKILTPSDGDPITLKFIFYTLQNLPFKPAGHSRHWISKFTKFSVPWPPREVRAEIVRILDTFTALEAELEAELEARRKQYEYYRDELLTFPADHDVECVPLAKLGKWQGGMTPSKSNPSFWTDGTVPWISPKDMGLFKVSTSEDHITEEAIEQTNSKTIEAPFIAVVTRSSILMKNLPVAVVDVPAAINQDLKALTPSPEFNVKYVAYAISASADEILRATRKQGGSVSSIDFRKLLAHKIPVPPLEEQERIVAILDKFDALVNDISSGLPAEIEARRKQYEYYRDKLLTFPELKEDEAA